MLYLSTYVISITTCYICQHLYILSCQVKPLYFEVLEKVTSNNRPVVIKAHDADKDVILNAPMAVLVQPLGLWRQVGDELSVFPESDPVWMSIFELAPFGLLASSLLVHQVRVSDCEGCYDLFDAKRVAPSVGVLHPSCPTYTVSRALLDGGYERRLEEVAHAARDELVFDGRGLTIGRTCVPRVGPRFDVNF